MIGRHACGTHGSLILFYTLPYMQYKKNSVSSYFIAGDKMQVRQLKLYVSFTFSKYSQVLLFYGHNIILFCYFYRILMRTQNGTTSFVQKEFYHQKPRKQKLLKIKLCLCLKKLLNKSKAVRLLICALTSLNANIVI